ncbi:TPR-like protein [Macrolepiota fuliginosa MF-IS2]|uniref:TPR-like protein n=1 Tax=Macrolepiota fuliginosa MF-IS2 TaxID=1400762 RepID=A0A9P5X5U5_9AGAR|nr:TPR-like protein [Macrolepiota fuliginosa MF-IS2]
MSNPKERHYWTQLRAALTAGQWRSSFPAKAPNGTLLPWSELFRKFNKHCKGFRGVAEVALQTRILGSYLATEIDDEDVTGNTMRPPLDLGDECIVGPEGSEDTLAGYESLKGLESSNSLNFALAYYAYALNRPFECLEYLARVPDILIIQNHIPTSAPTQATAGALIVASHRAEASVSSFTASFVSLADPSTPEIRDGRGWAMAEAFRGICLQGMSYERLYPSEPRRALQAYLSALPLFTILTSEFTLSSSTQAAGKLDFTPFLYLREMWRWVERLLWRAVILSSRLCDIHQDDSPDSLWQWFDHYSACSATWPSSFRTAHRSAVSSIYLRAFVLRYRVLSESPIYIPKAPSWLHQARVLAQDYRAILGSSTTFPHASEKNEKVEELVDLSVAVWEASGGAGEYASWVIDILWWATRYTFNSPRVYRHMTRLFHLTGDTPLAIRTLKLYVQIVGKACQASEKGVHEDVDSDDLWVETLVFGIRMMCRYAAVSDDPEIIDDVRYAGTLVEKARSRLNKEKKLLVACVFLAEGVWNSIMAFKEEDSYTRPQRLRDAHNCFIQSVRTHPTSSGYYHLALSFARANPSRDLEKAIESAGLALEADPKEIRYWHLLGLLLTAQEKWKEAAEILERGAELDREVSGELDDDDEDDADEEQSESEAKEENGYVTVEREQVVIKADDLSPPTPPQPPNGSESIPAHSPLCALAADATLIPPASGLLRSMLEKNPPSKRDVYEYSLQLRMTQAALTEVVEGPEGAEQKWVEVFSWIAEKKGILQSSDRESLLFHLRRGWSSYIHTDSHRLSLESAVPPSMMDKTFTISHVHEPLTTNGASTEIPAPSPTHPTSQLIVAPIPITISPATPTNDVTHDVPQGIEEIFSEKGRGKIDGLRVKRSMSIDRGDTSKSKKVQQILKDRVHKGRAGITAVSRKIGHGVSRHHHLHLRRANSSPDFHEVIRNASYQASSIHSRRRLGSFLQLNDRTPEESSTPPPPPPPPAQLPVSQLEVKPNSRQARENRLLSDLWLMSAATFRRLGKIEQAKGGIQEAEVKDEGNSNVWVQLGLYYFALGHRQEAIDALQKALFINTDDVSATVHLSHIYLTLPSPKSQQQQHAKSVPTPIDDTMHNLPTLPTATPTSTRPPSFFPSKRGGDEPDRSNIDLVAGLLSHLTRGRGWDVPEAWYFLAKAYGVQGRKEKEREALKVALRMAEGRGVREVQSALGWCI